MEHQKIINFLDNTQSQPSKFRTKIWVEVNDQSDRTYNINGQVKFKTSMLRSSLCDYRDVYIVASATITVANTATAANSNNRKNIIIKNCAPFTSWISEINNTQIDNAKEIHILMSVFNLMEYSDDYLFIEMNHI